jgi:hypothetical protein
MARSTGKDHARVNLDIWGNEDWLDLSPAAQHLYFILWTSPQLSYCGAGDWHPGKIAKKAKGWTPARVEAAAAELSRELFIIIDTETDEYLLRSWVKHDGLWRGPNMAVSMANARADLASRMLRGVIVHEVLKLKKRDPESNSWKREAVVNMLDQTPIDPADIPSFTPELTLAPTLNGTPPPTVATTPPLTHNNGVGVDPCANPGATPAPAPTSSSILQSGYVSRERHQDAEHDSNAPPPSPTCEKHPGGTELRCHACGEARKAREAWDGDQSERVTKVRAAFWAEVRNCPDCDQQGNVETSASNFLAKCPNHDWGLIHA